MSGLHITNEIKDPLSQAGQAPDSDQNLLCRLLYRTDEQLQESCWPHEKALGRGKRSNRSACQSCQEGNLFESCVARRNIKKVKGEHAEGKRNNERHLESPQHVLVLSGAEDEKRDRDKKKER